MGVLRTGAFAAVAIAAMTVAGCNSSRLSGLDTTQPAPLAAAPSGTVTGGSLPPPASPDPTAFPPAPGATTTAALDPAAVAPAAAPAPNAPDVTAGAVAGVWNASVSGQSCKVATPQTKFGAGFRAGPLRCPAPLDGVKSWSVAGKQLTLHDGNGGVLARLYASGPEKFDGQTEGGIPVSLTR